MGIVGTGFILSSDIINDMLQHILCSARGSINPMDYKAHVTLFLPRIHLLLHIHKAHCKQGQPENPQLDLPQKAA